MAGAVRRPRTPPIPPQSRATAAAAARTIRYDEIPALDGPTKLDTRDVKLWYTAKQALTGINIKIVSVTQESREQTRELYGYQGTLPGEEWARCAVVLHTATPLQPTRFAASELVLSGIPTGTRLENSPWHD